MAKIQFLKIEDKENFELNYDFLPQSLIDEKEFPYLMEYSFFPVKNKTENSTTIATSNENLIKLATKKNVLQILQKYLNINHEEKTKIILLPAKLYFEIAPRLLDSMTKDISEAEDLLIHILTESHRKGSSDIHFTWTSKGVLVRFRVDGFLLEFGRPEDISHEKGYRLRNVLITKADEDPYIENGLGGMLSLIIDHKIKHYRLSTIKTSQGFTICLRDESEVTQNISLEKLGYAPKAIKIIRENIYDLDFGLFLVTGPTGSGKSTLLATIEMEMLRAYSYIIKTVEDPVEIRIDGIDQVQVDEKGDQKRHITFVKAIKEFLREDPDLIVVGEVRDKAVAESLFTAARTGHIAASTLHTNNYNSTIVRLTSDMGIEKRELYDALRASISQKLINKLCPKCKIKKEEMGVVYFERNMEGCEFCRTGSEKSTYGYKGRIPIVEIAILRAGLDNILMENLVEYYSMEENILYLLENGIIDKELADKEIELTSSEDINISLTWKKVLSEGNESNKITPFFQKIIDKENNIIGYETLIRMKSESGEVLSPKQFIDFSKRKGFYGQLSIFLLNKLINIAKQHDTLFFFNIDKDNISNPDFIEIIFTRIKNEGLKRFLIPEITFDASEEVIDFIRRCNENNVKISLDNVEGDIKSISIIKNNNLDIDFIKTSLSATNLFKNKEYISNYIKLLKGVSDNVIINFIEEEKDFEVAKSLANLYQGFLIDKPSEEIKDKK